MRFEVCKVSLERAVRSRVVGLSPSGDTDSRACPESGTRSSSNSTSYSGGIAGRTSPESRVERSSQQLTGSHEGDSRVRMDLYQSGLLRDVRLHIPPLVPVLALHHEAAATEQPEPHQSRQQTSC